MLFLQSDLDIESDWINIQAHLSEESSHFLRQRLGGRTFNHVGDQRLQEHIRHHAVDVFDKIRERELIRGILKARDREFHQQSHASAHSCNIM